MIVRSRRANSLSLLVTCYGSIIPSIRTKIFSAFLVGILASVIRFGYLGSTLNNVTQISFGPFTALGVAVSLFLGFHNNASYARWWEARTLWGTQIIHIRNLARFLVSYCNGPTPNIQDWKWNEIEKGHFQEDSATSSSDNSFGNDTKISQPKQQEQQQRQQSYQLPSFHYEIEDWRIHLIILSMAQTHALRAQLRPYAKSDGENQAINDRNRFLTSSELARIGTKKNPANAILVEMGIILGKAYKNPENQLDTYTMVQLSEFIDQICVIQTACERIHNTSLPLAYTLLVTRTSVMYVFLVPFAMASTMGWWTALFSAIIAYTFFGLDKLARQIMSPFNDKPSCLALSAMCRTMEIDCLEILGFTTPEFLKPVKDVLM